MSYAHAVYRKSKKTILNTDRNQTVFAVKIAPYCVSFLDHISPLCSAKAALSDAIFPRNALSSSYPCSVSMLFLGGDPIEAGLCPLKLPRCSVVFSADDIVF